MKDEQSDPKRRENEMWVIYVTGYGSFFFKGTRKAAQLVMKGWQEGWPDSIVRKRRATPEEVKSNTPPLRIPAKEQVRD